MMRQAALTLIFAGALTACRSPTQITVDVSTDVACSEVSVTTFTSGELGSIETAPPTTESTTCSPGGHLGTVVLVPSGANNAEVGFKVVTALNGESADTCASAPDTSTDTNCIVERRALRYIPNTALDVIVHMSKACAGQFCDPLSTCVNGTCVNAIIPDPAQCEGAGCTESVLPGEDGGEGEGGVDAGHDATIADATVVDGTAVDSTVNDAHSADGPSPDAPPDAPSDAPHDATSDAPATDASEASAPTDAGPLLDAAPCDLGGYQAGSPWPMDGFCPNGRARSPLVGPSSATYKWQRTLASGFNYGGMSVGADGTIYVGTTGSKADNSVEGGVVEALSPEGGVLWVYTVEGGAVFDQTPVIAADSTLRFWEYLQGVYTVLSLDGGVVLQDSTLSVQSRGGVVIVSGGTLYAADNGTHLNAYSPVGDDLSLLWSAPGAYDYTTPSVAPNGNVYIDDTSTLVRALASDGGLLWVRTLDGGSNAMGSVSIAPDGTLRVLANNDSLYALDPSDGGLLWGGQRFAIDAGDGAYSGMAIADDGTTYIGTSNGLVAVDLAGKLVNYVDTNGAWAPIVDAQGNVYVLCDVGSAMCSYDHTLTTRRWKASLPGAIGSSAGTPVIGPGQMVYVISTAPYGAGVIYAFGP
jgi:outer membrane protein assembly factor BamB